MREHIGKAGGLVRGGCACVAEWSAYHSKCHKYIIPSQLAILELAGDAFVLDSGLDEQTKDESERGYSQWRPLSDDDLVADVCHLVCLKNEVAVVAEVQSVNSNRECLPFVKLMVLCVFHCRSGAQLRAEGLCAPCSFTLSLSDLH